MGKRNKIAQQQFEDFLNALNVSAGEQKTQVEKLLVEKAITGIWSGLIEIKTEDTVESNNGEEDIRMRS